MQPLRKRLGKEVLEEIESTKAQLEIKLKQCLALLDYFESLHEELRSLKQ